MARGRNVKGNNWRRLRCTSSRCCTSLRRQNASYIKRCGVCKKTFTLSISPSSYICERCNSSMNKCELCDILYNGDNLTRCVHCKKVICCYCECLCVKGYEASCSEEDV